MSPRIKKLIGFAIFLPVLVVYMFAAAALGERTPDNQIIKILYYLFAGVAWAYPAQFLMQWMNSSRNGSERDNSQR